MKMLEISEDIEAWLSIAMTAKWRSLATGSIGSSPNTFRIISCLGRYVTRLGFNKMA